MWEVLVMLRIARLGAPRVLHHVIRSNMKDTIMFFLFFAIFKPPRFCVFLNPYLMVLLYSITLNATAMEKTSHLTR